MRDWVSNQATSNIKTTSAAMTDVNVISKFAVGTLPMSDI